jgi:hypothetical protein
MSGIASAGVGGRSIATARQVRRRGKKFAELYWRLLRPRPAEYAKAAAGIAICRLVAAVMASLAITLCGFLGVVVGNMNDPHWPTRKNLVDGWAIGVAAVPAVVQLSRLIPAIVLFSAILISIPRAHIWFFRISLLGAMALGYCQRYLPTFPQLAATADATRKIALSASWTQRHLAALVGDMQVLQAQQTQHENAKQQVTWVLPVYVAASLIIFLLAYAFYRAAYVLTLRRGSLFPRRARIHSSSGFYVTALSRRIMAMLVTAGLLLIDLWLLQDIHSSLPAAHYGAAFSGYNHIAAVGCALAAFGAALMVCIPGPRGYRRLWVMLLVAVTAYPVTTHVYLLHLPAWIPPAPRGFWMIVITYLLVTGFCFDLVAALLEWPFYIPLFARRATRPTTLR